MRSRADNPGQPTGGHRTSHRSPTGGHRGGHDTFCGGQRWTTGGLPVATTKCVTTEKTTGIRSKYTKKPLK